MAEEQITYKDLPAEHKKKYDELKAIAELIGSSETTRSRNIKLRGNTCLSHGVNPVDLSHSIREPGFSFNVNMAGFVIRHGADKARAATLVAKIKRRPFHATGPKMMTDDQAHEDEHTQEIEEAQIEGQDGNPNDQVDQVTPPRPKRTKEEIEARRLARRDRTLEIRGHTHDKVLGDVRAKVSTRRQLANFSNHHAYISVVEPKKVFEALEDWDWVEAMHEELNNFKRNKVWTLVEKPKECRNVIGTKWIFKNKQDEFGNIVRNKARLVAQGRTSRGTSRRRPRADRSSDEFVSNAPRKSTSSRHKNKASRENYKAMDPISYSAIRLKNWYEDLPRDEETEGRKYWCMEQEFIYKDIYEPMNKLRPMQAIDVDVLAINNHFEDAIWLTEGRKNAMFDLYTSAGKVGTTKGLLPIYGQLLRFFRSTIAPSGGNNDAIRGSLVDLMCLSLRCARDENEEHNYTIDIMDYIFHEIHDTMVSRTTITYAPYIQLLINNTAGVSGEDLSGYPLMKHSIKKAYKLKLVSTST
ncbi:hypothetical protein QYE76_053844 [Lolium multiflorum]|uniref:Reverse transcriptase Ty1/copia-type domain-containing protein n=1 Tax=Lolium multiflorum TaxID=4521 RepID=A0AAD8SXY8_LOLMU|nr:hypothetical protein QYE76_053844 [Lolium multiflorum]